MVCLKHLHAMRVQCSMHLLTCARASHQCAGEAKPTGQKKKRIIKLTRKQKLRKVAKVARGEALVDQREKKNFKDARKLDQKLAAKSLW